MHMSAKLCVVICMAVHVLLHAFIERISKNQRDQTTLRNAVWKYWPPHQLSDRQERS